MCQSSAALASGGASRTSSGGSRRSASAKAALASALRPSLNSALAAWSQKPPPASAVAPIDAPQYHAIAGALHELDAGLPVAPGLVLGGTDTKWYGRVSDAAYRFVPFTFDTTDLTRPHGTNERISIENVRQGIRFYGALIRRAAGDVRP